MKKILIILLCVLSMPAFAQDIKTYFLAMPDSLCLLLTKTNKADFIDFKESKMRAEVKNVMDATSEMTDLTKDYISINVSKCSTMQLKLIVISDSLKVIGMINTYCAPLCDSSIHFYSTDWKTEYPVESLVAKPSMEDFFQKPDDSEKLYNYNLLRPLVNLNLMKADFSKEKSAIIFTLTSLDNLEKDNRAKIAPFVKSTIIKDIKKL